MSTVEKAVTTVAPAATARSRLSWEDIALPGAYVSVQSGKLFRITENALVRGASPAFMVQGDGGPYIRLDANPYVHNEKARLLCAEENISPEF